jgi:S-adenosylmethionine:tRNA ribosyltransferase-isomerase
MRLEELDYDLPPELIADHPAEPRESCRLMVVDRRSGEIRHGVFTDLVECLKPGDLLALNTARVTPARLFAHRPSHEQEKIELLAIDAGDSRSAHVLAQPCRKLRAGADLVSAETGTLIRVVERAADGSWRLELREDGQTWRQLLNREGHVPLPPYILKRRSDRSDRPEDREWYQTTFADRDGAVAAPTAGLHFSEELLARIERRGVGIARLFLKVGPATFLPVRTATVEEHPIGGEEYEVSEGTAAQVSAARKGGGRIVAVGTTAVRTLESAAAADGKVKAGRGETRLLIAPPFRCRAVDALVTNFHLPRSTLLALVFAFAGEDLIRRAYAEAVARRYRFYSYGDAMLIL